MCIRDRFEEEDADQQSLESTSTDSVPDIENLQEQLLEAQTQVRELQGVAEEKHRHLEQLRNKATVLVSEAADAVQSPESRVGKLYGLVWQRGGCKSQAQFQLGRSVVFSSRDAVVRCQALCVKTLNCDTFLVGRSDSAQKNLIGACWLGRSGCAKDGKSNQWDAYQRFVPTLERGQCRLPGGASASDQSLSTTRGTLDDCALSLFHARQKDSSILNSEYSDQLKTCWVIRTKQAEKYVPNGKEGYTCLKLLGFASQPTQAVVNPGSVPEASGWCQGKSLKTGIYPQCLSTCASLSGCVAVRWVVANKRCDLLSACATPNQDKSWRHARFPTVERATGWCVGKVLQPGIYPQCIAACQLSKLCNGVRWQLKTKRCDLLETCGRVGCDAKHCNGRGSTYTGDGEYCEDKGLSCCSQLSTSNKKCKTPPCWNPGKVCPDGKPGQLADFVWNHALVVAPYNHEVEVLADGAVGILGSEVKKLPAGGQQIKKQLNVKPLKVGSIGGAISAKAYFGYDEEGSAFVYAAISRITLKDIAGLFLGGGSFLPSFFGSIGIGPFNPGLCQKRRGGSACFAYMSQNTGPTDYTIQALEPPLVIPSGIACSGRIEFLGASLGMEFSYAPLQTRLHMELVGGPMNLFAGQIKVCRTKHNCGEGPIMKLDVNLIRHEFGFVLAAFGKMGPIAEGGVRVGISATLQEFELTDVSLFGGFIKGELYIRLSPINPRKFFMSVKVITKAISRALQKACAFALVPIKTVLNAIKWAKEKADAAFKAALAGLEKAENGVKAAAEKCAALRRKLDSKKRKCNFELELLDQHRSSPRRLQLLLASLQTGEGALTDEQLQKVYASVELEAGFKREDLIKMMNLIKTQSFKTDEDLLQVGYGNPFKSLANRIKQAAQAVARAAKAALAAACKAAISAISGMMQAACYVGVKIAQGVLSAARRGVTIARAAVGAIFAILETALKVAKKVIEELLKWTLNWIKFTADGMSGEVKLAISLTKGEEKRSPPTSDVTWVKANCPQTTYWKLGHARDVLSTTVTYPACKSTCGGNPNCAAYTVGARNQCTQYSINSFACAQWPNTATPYKSNTQRCENGNKLKDGFEYKYNKLGKQGSVCGNCQCCRRPVKISPPTRACKPFAGAIPGQYKRCPAGAENGWSKSVKNCKKTYWKFTAPHVYRTILPSPTLTQCQLECAKDTACAAYLIDPAVNTCILYSAIGGGPVSKCSPFIGGTFWGQVKDCTRTPPSPPLVDRATLEITFSLNGAKIVQLAAKMFMKLFKAVADLALKGLKALKSKMGFEMMLLATNGLLEEPDLVSLSQQEGFHFNLTELRAQNGMLFDNSTVLQQALQEQTRKRQGKQEYLEMLESTSQAHGATRYPMSPERMIQVRNHFAAQELNEVHSKAAELLHDRPEEYFALRQQAAKEGKMDNLDGVVPEDYVRVKGSREEFDRYDLNHDGVIDHYEQSVEIRKAKEAYNLI
eukprot:TRINITY_DN9408_c0_g1_i5.p1 TRINITY_DN9408_c0_g1~~TRINITY_DN9408_c0_g1_i5.p1  ORF type:complete len:1473 (-),score=263.60 TRINITY_DN9408_c0_g1_i5:225-4643(-)